MLLDKEKAGVGPRRLARATAFLEASRYIDNQAQRAALGLVEREMLYALADEFRDMAMDERRAYAEERKDGAEYS